MKVYGYEVPLEMYGKVFDGIRSAGLVSVADIRAMYAAAGMPDRDNLINRAADTTIQRLKAEGKLTLRGKQMNPPWAWNPDWNKPGAAK